MELELLLKTFSLSEEEFENYNKKSTEHVKSYFNNTMEEKYKYLYDYFYKLDSDLPEYCEFGADKCKISNFKEFCNNLDIDIVENLSRIIKEYNNIFQNKHEIFKSPGSFFKRINDLDYYHFYNKNKTFMFTCTSPLFMDGSLSYFGCTGEQKYVVKAFEMICNDKNRDLCYGSRDYA